MLCGSTCFTLFPYTTLFRSRHGYAHRPAGHCGLDDDQPLPTPPSATGRAPRDGCGQPEGRSEEHTTELQSRGQLVCRLQLEKKKCGSEGNNYYTRRTLRRAE